MDIHARLLAHLQDAVMATDPQSVVTVWSGAAERMYGWTASDAVGRDVRRVVLLELGEREEERRRDELRTSGRWRGRTFARGRAGARRHVEVTDVVLEEGEDAPGGVLSVHHEVAHGLSTEATLESITDAFYALDREWRFTYVNERARQALGGMRGAPLAVEDLLGASVWELFPETVGTVGERAYREALRERHTVVFEDAFPPDGPWFEVHAYPSDHGLAVYFRDVTDRHRAEAERERRAREQARVAELGLRALGSHDLQSLMDEAVGLVAQTLGVELTAIAELLGSGEALLLRAGTGWREGLVGHATEPAGRDSQAGFALLSREPVVSADLAREERFAPSPLVREHGGASGIAVVIEGRQAPFGVLAAISTQPRPDSPPGTAFMQAVANVLAAAVERAQAEELLRDVRESERSRIARDLHDDALQELTYVLARASAPASAEAAAERLAGFVPALERVGEQLRGAIYDLRLGGQEKDRSFRDLLAELVQVHRAMADEAEMVLDLQDGVPDRPLGTLGTEVLRIVGEALTNARRHAGPCRVVVRAWGRHERLSVDVVDDGAGFDPARPHARADGGTGLTGMRERADLIQAELDVTSRPGEGTRVRLRVPLGAGVEAAAEARILLVEDHVAVREAIAGALEREPGLAVAAQAASLAEARGMLEDVDLAVVDLGLPDGYGCELIPELRATNPRAQALVLSAALDRAQIARAVDSGASGVISKTARLGEVVDAVRRLRAGETLLPLEEVGELLRFARRRREEEREERRLVEQLTRREREVLQAMADGLDSRGVAERLHITVRTGRNHVANILAKLGVHSQLQALVIALRHDVVQVRRDPGGG